MTKNPRWLTWAALVLVLTAPTLCAADAANNAAQIAALMSRYHEFGQFNGTVLVAERGEVIYKEGFGWANMEWNIPNTPDTKFRLGSITKQFTATLILQLAAEGKLDLHGFLAKYLPEYPKGTADKVTIHHLLTHTSGIPSYTSLPTFWKEMVRDPTEPLEFIKVFADKGLEFDPGAKFRYNNSGYFLLGVIIEKLTGETYEETLQQKIFRPLGMKDSGYDHHETLIPRRAAGYRATLDGYENASYVDTSWPYAAGALYSTVEDLYTWDRALYADKVLPADYKKLMFTGHQEWPTPERSIVYGYGWGIEKVRVAEEEKSAGDSASDGKELTLIGHGGGIFGFHTLIQRIPEHKHLIVLLNNTGGTKLDDMAEGIRTILYGGAPKRPGKPISKTLYKTFQQDGVQAAIQRYGELKERQPESYDLSWTELNTLGHHLLEKKKTRDALEIFKLNVKENPKRPRAYVALADALREAGNKKLAVQNYARALELDPNLRKMIIDRLKELKEE